MHKSICLTAALLLALLSACSNKEDAPPTQLDSAVDELTQDDIDELESIGYLQGAKVDVQPASIAVFNKKKAQPGLNLYVSGHAPEAYLIDMEGNLLHTWRKPFDEIWPGQKMPAFAKPHMKGFFRQFHLFPNGDLLVNFEHYGIAKLDKNSEVLWSFKGHAHHDIEVDSDGNVYSLGKRVEYEKGDKSKWTLYPTVNILAPDGKPQRTLELYDYFDNSPYRAVLEDIDAYGDLLHNNTIRVFDGSQQHRSPLYKKGNILLASPIIDAVYIADPEQETLVWMLRSMFDGIHDPTLLDNGNILLFDNRGPDNRSQVIEFDPFTQEIIWQYDGGTENQFLSTCCSVIQRLPNGNTLAVVTSQATAFEVTPQKEIVWQFHNPASLSHNQRAGSLFELRRFTKEFPMDWLVE